MSKEKNQSNEDKETFEQLFYSFWQALYLLSKDAVTQCNEMGNYNVAWELKDDVFQGNYLVSLPGEFLTDGQRMAIKQFLSEINKIPNSVLKEAKSYEENILAMNNSCWAPIRKHASILLKTLEPVRENLSDELKKYLIVD